MTTGKGGRAIGLGTVEHAGKQRGDGKEAREAPKKHLLVRCFLS
jgi:hypothetical protein